MMFIEATTFQALYSFFSPLHDTFTPLNMTMYFTECDLPKPSTISLLRASTLKTIFNIEKLKYHCSAFIWPKYFRSCTSNLAEFRILKLLQENVIICLKHFEYFQIIPDNQCFCDIKTFLPIEAKPNFLF